MKFLYAALIALLCFYTSILGNIGYLSEHLVTPNQQAVDVLQHVEWHHEGAQSTESSHQGLTPDSLKLLYGQVVLFIYYDTDNVLYSQYDDELLAIQNKFPEELTIIGLYKKSANANQSKIIQHDIYSKNLNYLVGTYDAAELNKLINLDQNAPSFILVGPDGYYLSHEQGLGGFSSITKIIDTIIPILTKKRKIFPKSKLIPSITYPVSMLKLPSSISVDPENKRLAISDAGHHRILITNFDGEIVDIIGTGKKGWKNGSFSTSSLSHPKGTKFHGTSLYIADSGNRLIRVANFEDKKIATLSPVIPTASIFQKSPMFMVPHDIASSDESLFVTYPALGTVVSIDHTTKLTTQLPAATPTLNMPTSLDFNSQTLFVLDKENHAVFNAWFKRVFGTEKTPTVNVSKIGEDSAYVSATAISSHRGKLYGLDDLSGEFFEISQDNGWKTKTIDINRQIQSYEESSGDFHMSSELSDSGSLFIDMAIFDEYAYIVDAGKQKIWVLHIDSGVIEPLYIHL